MHLLVVEFEKQGHGGIVNNISTAGLSQQISQSYL